MAARSGRLALLFQHRHYLRPGHRERQQRVAKRLERERFAVGDDAVAFIPRCCVRQIGAQAAGVHERDFRTVGRGRPSLGVRYQVAGRRLDPAIRARRVTTTIDVGGDRPERAA